MTYMLIRFRVSNDIFDYILCALITLALFLFVTTLLSYKNKCFHFFAIIVAGVFACGYGVLTYVNAYYINSNTHLLEPDVFAALQSNSSEALFFFWEDMYTFWGIIFLFLFPAIIFYVNLRISAFFSDAMPLIIKHCIVISSVLFIFTTYNHLHLYDFINKRVFSYIDAVNSFKLDFSPQASGKMQNLKGEGEIYLVVIGESQTRDQMQIFSPYPSVANTPWLSKQYSNPDWVFFKNSFSFHTHTVQSLSAALTDKRAIQPSETKHVETILSLSKRYNMKTIWISNQSKSGLYENAITTLASTADVVRFTEENISNQQHDLEIIPILADELEKIEPKQNALIVLHLFGSHSPYRLRFPKDFTKTNITDPSLLGNFAQSKNHTKYMEYLTAIRYTDTVLEKVFHILEDERKPSVLIYFSDHGEDPIETMGHNFTTFRWSMTHIPFFIWISEKYNRLYPNKLSTLAANKNKFFTNDLIFDTYAGLLNINDEVYQGIYDIGNEDYSITIDNAVISDNIKIKDDYSVRTQAHDKLIALDSSSIFKLAQAHSMNISSFQLTVKYTKNNNGADDLIVITPHGKPITTLDSYINLTHLYFDFLFLDISNLSLENMPAIVSILEKINQKHHIKDRVCIGSLKLELFSNLLNNNWKMVYIIKNDENLTQNQLQNVVKYKFYGVDFPLSSFDNIKNKLNNNQKNLKFFARSNDWHFSDNDLTNKISPYEEIEKIGITFDSVFSN